MNRRLRALSLVWALPLVLLAAAPAHGAPSAAAGPATAPSGSADAQMRQAESATLGAEHAAAHARQRELVDEARSTPSERAAPPPLAPVAPHVGGAWSTPADLPVIAINAIMLPTGKVLMFAYPGRPGEAGSNYDNLAKAYVWDPATNTSESVDPPIDPRTGKPTNIWCGGASLLADGRVLVTGGNLDPAADRVFTGLNTVFVFDPWTQVWQRGDPMRQGRWYPTQTLMPDGRTLAISGLAAPGDPDFGSGDPASSGGMNNDAEVVSPDGASTTMLATRFNDPGQAPLSALYPHMFWMRSGQAMAAGPYPTDSWLFSPGTAGSAPAWTDLPNLARTRDWGTAVMLDDGRVMTLGGSPPSAPGDGAPSPFSLRPATATTEIFDEREPAPRWRSAPAMQLARSHANSVLLPDGTVATVGGGFGEDGSQQYYRWLYKDQQRRVELLDPHSGAPPVLGAAQAEARTYHSSALLLPDARVLSAGDDINGAGGPGTGISKDTAEIYSPPYLFKKDGSGALADRPQIVAAPATAELGAEIAISTAGVAASKAVLVAPGAATHANDMSQRIVPLAAPLGLPEGGLRLQVPSDANVILPGHYMLFVLSDTGVPSVARFIRITGASSAAPMPSGPTPAAPVDPPPAQVSPRAPGDPKRTRAAKLTVTGKLPSMRVLRRTGRFTLTVRLTRPGRVSLRALLERPRGKTIAIAPDRTMRFAVGSRRQLTFRLTARGRRLLVGRRSAILRIRARATPAAGNRLATLTIRRRLR
ncbi:MAG TPA: galactose oxidase-like domain-containing protein [Solirubrobacteraceae bacterium]|nr:galactose oxidase-like domain-containing protein [Solirubrobacteraceae bacterium]